MGEVSLDAAVAVENAAPLKHAHQGRFAVDVAFEYFEQRRQQRGTHDIHLRRNRVEQTHGLAIAAECAFGLFVDKAEVDGFLITQSGHLAAQGKAACVRLAGDAGARGRKWCAQWQVLVADHAHDFFDQVGFDR